MLNLVEYGADINWNESDLVHPAHADGLVDGGDPVVIGDMIGVAATSAYTTADLIAVRHNGVFNLPVVAKKAGTNTPVTIGAKIYIDPATAILSLTDTGIHFGWTCGNGITTVNAGATANVDIRLKHGAAR